MPTRRSYLWFAALVVWWVVVSQVSRAEGPGARLWTEVGFGVGLALTYVAAWAIAMDWSSASSRQGTFRLLATTSTIVVLLILLELPAMVGLVSYAAFMERAAVTDAFVADSDLGFRRPAGFSWTGQVRSDLASSWHVPIGQPKRLSFSTDARGFRNGRERDRADVILLGDSYVEGWYVSDDETAAAVLDSRLGRPVSNLGVSGFGTLQELEVLRHYGLSMQPTLVAWFFFEGNDLYDDQEFENTLLYLRDHEARELGFDLGLGFDAARFRRNSFLRNLYGRLRRTSHPLVRNPLPARGAYRDAAGASQQLYFHAYAAVPFTDYEQARFDTTKRAFMEGIALGREQGVTTVLFFVPMKFRVYGGFCSFEPGSPCHRWKPWELPARFTAFCIEEQINCVDLSVPMGQAASAGRLLYVAEDSHWNEDGHVFVADQVIETWNRLGLDADQRQVLSD